MSVPILRVVSDLSPSSVRHSAFRAALLRLEPEIRAVPPEQFVPMNINPHLAAGRVLNAAPRFLSLRARMASLAPELDLWLVDRCVPLAQAYLYTSAGYVSPRRSVSRTG